MMNKMVVNRGLPGSGKSTLAKNLSMTIDNPLKSVVLSTDDYYTFGGRYHFNGDKIRLAHEWNQWRADECCDKGYEIVVIDNTNTTWKEVEPYVEIGKRYGYDVSVWEPNTTWKFDIEECFKKNTHNVPKEVIQRMKDRWESTESINRKIRDYVVKKPIV